MSFGGFGFRSIHIGKSYEEAFERGITSTGAGWNTYFAGFGFLEAFRNPGEEAPAPLQLGGDREVFQRMVDHDMSICGTPDDIKRKIEKIATCYGEGELEWFGWLFPQGHLTWDEAEYQLETFGNEILPAFKN